MPAGGFVELANLGGDVEAVELERAPAPAPTPAAPAAHGRVLARAASRVCRAAFAVLLCVTFVSYCRESAIGEDHKHIVAISTASPSWQPLIERSRSIIRTTLELRDVSNRLILSDDAHPVLVTTVQLYAEMEGRWLDDEAAGTWNISLADDVRHWQQRERAEPGRSEVSAISEHRHEFDLGRRARGRARLHFWTNVPAAFAVVVQAQEMSSTGRHRWALAGVMVVACFGMIALELVPRLLAVGGGSLLLLGLMGALGERVQLQTVLGWVDAETVALLFGMMLIVGYLSQTGVFEHLAIRAFTLARGRPLPCVSLLVCATAALSAVLDNVTTVLLITPVTVQLCDVLGLPAVPVVTATILASNIGGAATVIGDPPNVMISSALYERGVTFGMFLKHVAPGALLALLGACAYLYWALRELWMPKRGAAAAAAAAARARKRGGAGASRQGQSADEGGGGARSAPMAPVPRDGSLSPARPAPRRARGAGPASALGCLRGGRGADGADDGATGGDEPLTMDEAAFEAQVARLSQRYAIRDPRMLARAGPVLCGVLVLFCAGPLIGDVELAWVPLWGAALLVTLHPAGLDVALERVEWPTLLFFGCLSVFMRGIEWLGLVRLLGDTIAHVIAAVPADIRLGVSLVVIVTSSALISAFVDNVPFTAAMIPIVQQLADSPATALPLEPLVTALALGTCLGGNGTIVAASANVVGAGVMQALGKPISFGAFARLGVPVCAITVAISAVYLLLRYHSYH